MKNAATVVSDWRALIGKRGECGSRLTKLERAQSDSAVPAVQRSHLMRKLIVNNFVTMDGYRDREHS